MNIDLIAAGTRSPEWVTRGYNEYEKRLPRDWKLNLKEVAVAKRRKGEPVDKLKVEEGEKMSSLFKPNSRIVALDSRGANWSTTVLAENFRNWQLEYRGVHFLVGGPDGLSEKCLAAAHDTWSLSRLTFPHFIVRILIAEQVYRAWSVLNNHPYHK